MNPFAVFSEIGGPAITYGAWGAVALVIMTWLKTLVPMFQSKAAEDSSLRSDLMGMVNSLRQEIERMEGERDSERNHYNNEIASVRQELASERARHSAEIQAVRDEHHSEMRVMGQRLNNERMKFQMLITLLKVRPDSVLENIAEIEKLQVEQDNNLSIERGAATGARHAKEAG
jgi:hypothetical protein